MKFLIGIILSYLIGSFPTAYLTGKLIRGVDIRKHGSGNVGATNVFRIIGKKWGIIVLILDMLKGSVVCSWIASRFGHPTLGIFVSAMILGLAAIAGHTWTIWLGFKGGKGVATTAGVFLTLAPEPAVVSLLVWIVLFSWKRYVSLASLGTALSFPLWIVCLYWQKDYFWILFPISVGIPIFIASTHRENIKRLREGTEKRLL